MGSKFRNLPCRVLLDTGAQVNFADSELLKLFPGHLVEELRPPIFAHTASSKTHQINFAAKICLGDPFNVTLEFYLLDGLKMLIIGEPTLRSWKYSLDDGGDYLKIEGRKVRLNSMVIFDLPRIGEELKATLKQKYPKLFDTTPRPPQDRLFKHEIITKDEIPVLLVPYFTTVEAKKVIKEFIKEKLEAGILVPAPPDAWLSPVFAIIQNGGHRVVVDLRMVNKKTVKTPCYLNNFRDFITVLKKLKLLITRSE